MGGLRVWALAATCRSPLRRVLGRCGERARAGRVVSPLFSPFIAPQAKKKIGFGRAAPLPGGCQGGRREDGKSEVPRWASADRGNKPTLRRTALGPCPVVCRGLAVCGWCGCDAGAQRPASPAALEEPRGSGVRLSEEPRLTWANRRNAERTSTGSTLEAFRYYPAGAAAHLCPVGQALNWRPGPGVPLVLAGTTVGSGGYGRIKLTCLTTV